MPKKWSQEEKDECFRLYRETNYSFREIADALNKKFNNDRTWKSIDNMLRYIVRDRNHNEYSSQEDKFILEHWDMPVKDIARRLGRTYYSVASRRRTLASKLDDNVLIFDDKKEIVQDYDDIWELVNKLQEAKKIRDPQQEKLNVEVKGKNKFIGITFLSDLHIGSYYTDHKTLKKHIELIQNTPNLFAILLGDLLDNFVIEWELTAEQLVSNTLQIKLVSDVIKKLQDKLLAIVAGDHEEFTYRVAGIGLSEEWSQFLNVPHLGFGGRIILKFGDIDYTIAVRHRSRYFSSINLTHAVKKMHDLSYPFDIGVLGHRHHTSIEQTKRQGEHKVFIACGSYQTSGRWASLRGYEKGDMTAPIVIISSDKKLMIPFKNIEDGIKVLEALNKE